MSAPVEPPPAASAAYEVRAEAFARTHSPSDRLAYAWDQSLIAHPEWCSTDADYPGWTPGAKQVTA